MSTLFRRAWTIQVDTLDVSALDCEFKILRSIKSVPNRCVLTIWNLNQDHRAQLLKRTRPDGKTTGITVRIEAGFVDSTSVLFSGDLREVAGQRDETNRKIVLSGDDGGRAFREGRINQSFAKGTPVSAPLAALATALGIGQGNTATFEVNAQILGIGTTLPHAMTLTGPAKTALDRLLGSMGLTWSVQRGTLQILAKGKPLDQGAIVLGPTTGLVGSPEASIDATVALGNPQQFAASAKIKARVSKPKDPGVIKLKSLFIPGMDPGRKIILNSEEFKNSYYLTEVESVGQTYGQEWHHNCVARVY